MDTTEHIRALITRLARLDAADTWSDDLNPAQVSALEYLSRANRFSRAPSHVAEYLGTTRGTMSQTLKALTRKGFISETRSKSDKRSIRYDLTDQGWKLLSQHPGWASLPEALPAESQAVLLEALTTLLKARLAQQGGRGFGLCHSCAHHRKTKTGAFCQLLNLDLAPEEPDQICHEQIAA